ncbi:MAG: dihydrofolate reductase [Candidatus Methylacidiphilales bacterium]|nr:dihydrofolate reductase [Candidatus Methylacidiphilales bacterium]
MKPRLIAIAAMDEARGIGKDGVLPWKIPGELKFFKETTTGHAILFGRTTYEGIGRPLPNRENLVLSRSLKPVEGIRILRRLEDLEDCGLPLVYVCGGTEVYRQLLPRCEALYLTRVAGTYPADAWFPPFENDFEFVTVQEETPAYRREKYLRRVFV